MKPEEYLQGDAYVSYNDYNILEDGTIVADFYVESDDYDGELQLTKEQIKDAIQFLEENDGCSEAIGNLSDGFWMIGKAEEEPDPLNPDLNRILGGDPPAIWVEAYGTDDPSP